MDAETVGRTTRVLMNPGDIVDRNILPCLSEEDIEKISGVASCRTWALLDDAQLALMPGQLAPRWCICRQKDFECAEACGWKEYPDDH